MSVKRETKPSRRLTSLDAYRGLVMLAMASGGFAFARVYRNHEEAVRGQFDGHWFHDTWVTVWPILAYQFEHVEWTGCSFWDLIQPSFLFMVGVSMPFSYSKREAMGQWAGGRLWHATVRSLILILLGVFLYSTGSEQTNFVFVNVLAQIGLGYLVVYLLWRRKPAVQLLAAAAILGGYWYYFYQYTIPEGEYELVRTYIAEQTSLKPEEELNQFDGLAGHWNKHTNAAAAFDRDVLNRFPRPEAEWHGRSFWINRGGYQTLNFIPSIVTILFGVMAGRLIRGDRSEMQKLKWLFLSGGICFIAAMSLDTSIWPLAIPGREWSFSPIVKRIWTPGWTLFSAGWTFWMLGLLYWIIDIRGWKWWTFPLVVVGMNSIAIYLMAQLLKPWIGRMLEIHLTTIDHLLSKFTVKLFGLHTASAEYLFGDGYIYAPIWESCAVLFVLWLICLWLYKRKIFLRI